MSSKKHLEKEIQKLQAIQFLKVDDLINYFKGTIPNGSFYQQVFKKLKLEVISPDEMVRRTSGQGLAYTDGENIVLCKYEPEFFFEIDENKVDELELAKIKELNEILLIGMGIHEIAHNRVEDIITQTVRKGIIKVYDEIYKLPQNNFQEEYLKAMPKFKEIVKKEVQEALKSTTLKKDVETIEKYFQIYLMGDFKLSTQAKTWQNMLVDIFIESGIHLNAQNSDEAKKIKEILELTRKNSILKNLNKLVEKLNLDEEKINKTSLVQTVSQIYIDPRFRNQYMANNKFNKLFDNDIWINFLKIKTDDGKTIKEILDLLYQKNNLMYKVDFIEDGLTEYKLKHEIYSQDFNYYSAKIVEAIFDSPELKNNLTPPQQGQDSSDQQDQQQDQQQGQDSSDQQDQQQDQQQGQDSSDQQDQQQDQQQGQDSSNQQDQQQGQDSSDQQQGQNGQNSSNQQQGQNGQNSSNQQQGQNGQNSSNQQQGQNGQDSSNQQQGQNGQDSSNQQQGQNGQDSSNQQQGQNGQDSSNQQQGQQGQDSSNQQQGQNGQNSSNQQQGQNGQNSSNQQQGQNGQDSSNQQQGQNGQDSSNQQQGQNGQDSSNQQQGQNGQNSSNQQQGQNGQNSSNQQQGQNGQNSSGQQQGQNGQDSSNQQQGQNGQNSSGQQQGQNGQNSSGQQQGQQGQDSSNQQQGQNGQNSSNQQQGQQGQNSSGQQQGQNGQNSSNQQQGQQGQNSSEQQQGQEDSGVQKIKQDLQNELKAKNEKELAKEAMDDYVEKVLEKIKEISDKINESNNEKIQGQQGQDINIPSQKSDKESKSKKSIPSQDQSKDGKETDQKTKLTDKDFKNLKEIDNELKIEGHKKRKDLDKKEIANFEKDIQKKYSKTIKDLTRKIELKFGNMTEMTLLHEDRGNDENQVQHYLDQRHALNEIYVKDKLKLFINILLDGSGSMGSVIKGSKDRRDDITRESIALMKIILEKIDGIFMNIYNFTTDGYGSNSKLQTIQDYNGIDIDNKRKTDIIKLEGTKNLMEYEADGGTPLYASMIKMIQKLKDQQRKTNGNSSGLLFVFSDGEDSSGNRSLEETTQKMMKALERDKSIKVVLVGIEDSTLGRVFGQENFVQIRNVEDFTKFFLKEIEQIIDIALSQVETVISDRKMSNYDLGL